MAHEWMQMRCKDAWLQRRQRNGETKGSKGWIMLNLFLSSIHYLVSFHSLKVQTPLHQLRMRFLHIPSSPKTGILLWLMVNKSTTLSCPSHMSFHMLSWTFVFYVLTTPELIFGQIIIDMFCLFFGEAKVFNSVLSRQQWWKYPSSSLSNGI